MSLSLATRRPVDPRVTLWSCGTEVRSLAPRGGNRETRVNNGCGFGSLVALVSDPNTHFIWESFAVQVRSELEERFSVRHGRCVNDRREVLKGMIALCVRLRDGAANPLLAII